MRKVLVMTLGILCAVPFASPQNADEGVAVRGGSAETLLNDCSAVNQMDPQTNAVPAKDVQRIQFCFGYVLGVIDMHSIMAAGSGRVKDTNYCIPANASWPQLAKVVVKYGNDHPEVLNQAALILISDAFSQAFPCQQ